MNTAEFDCGCCLYSKGKNFRANHNHFDLFIFDGYAVAYIAKVRILEQITTAEPVASIAPRLLLISQR